MKLREFLQAAGLGLATTARAKCATLTLTPMALCGFDAFYSALADETHSMRRRRFLEGVIKMGKILLAGALALSLPLSATAGPKEDAFQVLERFKKAFDASDMQTVVSLFAPDALFLPTTNPKLLTTAKEFDDYFQPLKQLAPLSMKIDSSSAIVLSDKAVLFTGMDTFGLTQDGKDVEVPARYTILVTKGDRGWRISHFHSSARPGAPSP